MNLEIGKEYFVTLENGQNISGKLDEVKYSGDQIILLWIDIGGLPVYIAFSDVKSIE